MTTILHFCARADWLAAQAACEYRHESLEKEGFIHFSGIDQVHKPANELMKGRTDLVLLEVNEAKTEAEVRYEPSEPSNPKSEKFPHLYGPLNLDAIIGVHPFPCGADGTFSVPRGVRR